MPTSRDMWHSHLNPISLSFIYWACPRRHTDTSSLRQLWTAELSHEWDTAMGTVKPTAHSYLDGVHW